MMMMMMMMMMIHEIKLPHTTQSSYNLPRVQHQGPRARDQRPWGQGRDTRDQGPRTRVQRRATNDKGPRTRGHGWYTCVFVGLIFFLHKRDRLWIPKAAQLVTLHLTWSHTRANHLEQLANASTRPAIRPDCRTELGTRRSNDGARKRCKMNLRPYFMVRYSDLYIDKFICIGIHI